MVTERRLKYWLGEVRNGRRTPAALLDTLRHLPYENLGFARLDTHRGLRRGLPEAIFCDGKTPQQIIQIARRAARRQAFVLLTRLDVLTFDAIRSSLPNFRYDPIARLAHTSAVARQTRAGLVVVVTGGTSDIPVAEEASVTLELLGSRAARLYDVGVAGVHRLLGQLRLLHRARAIIVIAGMEGALASVVAGLVRCPVIAVPTSIGYGASFQGIAPLLTMLNSCVPGVGVVNIDNGFGAAYLAHVINHPPRQRS